jgi:type IX secretion system PorP/SprF family membrane protein
MRTKRLKLIFAISFLFLLRTAHAQDPAFSQYYASGLYLNPSLAGIEPNWAASLNYRYQWGFLGKAFNTSQLSFIVPFHSKKITKRHLGGAGVSLFNDRAPVISTNNVESGYLMATGGTVNAAYILPLTRLQNIIFGVQVGGIYKTLDLSSLQWGSQFDPNVMGGYNRDRSNPVAADGLVSRKLMPDVGAGVLYYFNVDRDYRKLGYSAFAGFSAYHLNRPNESLVKGNVSRLPVLLKGHAGVEITLTERINVSPNVLIAIQDKVNQVNAGAYFTYLFSDSKDVLTPNTFILGGWYRLRDAVIFSTGLGNSYYTLGFSFDLNSSNLRYSTKGQGAYEISLKITQPRNKKKIRFHTPRI